MIRLLSASMVCVLLACGGAMSGEPTREFNLGVDIRNETQSSIDALSRVGYVVDSRVDAIRFTAFSMHRGASQTLVRVVTTRGVVLSIEGDASAFPATQAVSLRLPSVDDSRLRRGSEVVVATTDASLERSCLSFYSVRDDDSVRQVPVRLGELLHEGCVEEIRDIDGDDALEPLVPWRVFELARTDTPTLLVPLARDAGTEGFVASRVAFTDFFERERLRREADLARARTDLDVEHAYTLAVELALIRLLRTGSGTNAVAVLDDAMQGLVLSESSARSLTDTRARIREGMTPSPTSDREPSHVESRRP